MAHEREVKTLLELPEVEQITDDLLRKYVFGAGISLLTFLSMHFYK